MHCNMLHAIPELCTPVSTFVSVAGRAAVHSGAAESAAAAAAGCTTDRAELAGQEHSSFGHLLMSPHCHIICILHTFRIEERCPENE
jgi:hypothetical protein